jgi:hypothetical protein
LGFVILKFSTDGIRLIVVLPVKGPFLGCRLWI